MKDFVCRHALSAQFSLGNAKKECMLGQWDLSKSEGLFVFYLNFYIPFQKNKTVNSVKHIMMNSSLVTPQAIAGSERNHFNIMFIAMNCSDLLLCVVSSYFALWKYCDVMQFLNLFILVLSLVWPKRISRPESFITEVAGDDDSFKVVSFNVIFYSTAPAFLSTNFA